MSGPVVPPNCDGGRLALIGRVALGASAVAVGMLAVVLGSPSQQAVGQSCAGQFTINFNGLPAGTIIGEQYAASGVHISAVANENHPDALIVFDTNAPPTHDPDLAVDIGNIAVLAENVRDENGDGLVDDPDENNFGGRAIVGTPSDRCFSSAACGQRWSNGSSRPNTSFHRETPMLFSASVA